MGAEKIAKKKDFVILAGLLVLCLLLLGFFALKDSLSGGELRAEVYLKDERIAVLSLSEDRDVVLPEVPAVTLRIEGGRIRFLRSDCPDRTCIETGWLSAPGHYAVCLPNQLSVRIVGGNGPDAVTGRVRPERACPAQGLSASSPEKGGALEP